MKEREIEKASKRIETTERHKKKRENYNNCYKKVWINEDAQFI
jgi:hypothetical protein